MGGRAIFYLTILLIVDFGLADDHPNEKLVKETGICGKCKCKDNKVDCIDQSITEFFSVEEWNDLKELKPTHVDFSKNSIGKVTLIGNLPIKILNLSRCAIEFIENGSFKYLQNMTVLDLSHNKLTSTRLSPRAFQGRYTPEEYESLAGMRKLNLAYNDLHSLDQALFEYLPQLTELDLSGNPLTTIGRFTSIAISGLPRLKVLHMRSCQLTDIPNQFFHTPRYLERLDISDNQLTLVPQGLKETKNLIYLNLNHNPITELDVTSEDQTGFPRMPKLQELHMCNMKLLRSIGANALAGLENLERLHMSFNPKLQYIDPKAMARPSDKGETYAWPNIKELHLQSNKLSHIDNGLLPRWDLLEKIDISNNPFLCDCTAQWIVDILVPMIESKTKNATANMVCEEPIEMMGYTMKHLHDNHHTMRCLDKDTVGQCSF